MGPLPLTSMVPRGGHKGAVKALLVAPVARVAEHALAWWSGAVLAWAADTGGESGGDGALGLAARQTDPDGG